MAVLRIQGGTGLVGEIDVSGSKNGALALMAASLLVDGPCTIHNIPHISDVDVMVRVLESLGARAELDKGGTLHVDASTLSSFEAPNHLVRKMRASFSVLGPLLARLGRARVPMPGGCDIGNRPVNFHIQGIEKLGAIVDNDRGVIDAEAEVLNGALILLNFPSAGATQQIMAAATLARGTTTIKNAAREPEITDVARFLNLCGAKISGAGTDTIVIEGVQKLHGCEYSIIADRVEAGTYAIAAANTRGDVLIRKADPEHLEALIVQLQELGVRVAVNRDGIRVSSNLPCRVRPPSYKLTTSPYPGFPTDLQQPFGALLTTADGSSMIVEKVYEHRLKYLDQLAIMGADVTVDSSSALIRGVPRLHGADVTASDLRAGAALVVAALAAEGETRIFGLDHIYRGYEKLECKLKALGASVHTGEAILC